MTDLLMIWCKKANFPYRQGMNEIIAIVMYAFYSEKLECKETDIELCCKDATLSIRYMNGTQFLDADIFSTFDKIMAIGAKELFVFEDQKSVEERTNKIKKDQLFGWSPLDTVNVTTIIRMSPQLLGGAKESLSIISICMIFHFQ